MKNYKILQFVSDKKEKIKQEFAISTDFQELNHRSKII